MKTYKKVEKDVVDDVICDMCHKSCKRGMNHEYLEVYGKWGYESGKDMTKWEAYFCSECSDKIDEFVRKEGGEITRDAYFLVL